MTTRNTCETPPASHRKASKNLLHRQDPLPDYDADVIVQVPRLGLMDESILVGAAAHRSFDITLTLQAL